MQYRIYLDDLRYPSTGRTKLQLILAWIKNFLRFKRYTCGVWTVCRNSKAFKKSIQEWKNISDKNYYPYPLYISFDHDLGDKDPENGKSLMNWFINYLMDNLFKNDGDPIGVIGKFNLSSITVNVHSANTVGAENIQKMWDNFVDFKLSGN